VAENQPGALKQNRMPSELSDFAARLREAITAPAAEKFDFPMLARELFQLQFAANPVCRRICESRGVMPQTLKDWRETPAVPTAAFKEFEVTCLPIEQRDHVFHSSGTTEQRPSRHFHSAESLGLYEASLWPWFRRHVLPDSKSEISNFKFIALTPPPAEAPHSSLVHMLETVRRHCGAPESAFLGVASGSGEWTLRFAETLAALRESVASGRSLVLLGTAFSFVHLLDSMAQQNLRFELPPGSRAMETGGYKGRSRSLPKAELHALITARLGILPSHIVCEYGMSELSSQAYDKVTGDMWQVARRHETDSCHPTRVTRHFHFPPWARAQVISPETGREVVDGETGLIRVFDLANVWSVMAIQTEDLGIRRGDGFELLGRAKLAEPRGCSLMPA
jgi:hypothetical protein